EVIFNGLTGFLVQSFFTYGVWTCELNHGCNLHPFNTLRLAYVIQGGHRPTFVELKELKPLSMTINVLAAAGDVAISVAFCTFLEQREIWIRNSNPNSRQMLFSINTRLLTSICACCSLIFASYAPPNLTN
ncbi:hypothetical protein IW262DRAFT_1268191, partial [Armillaria fumosa]